MKEKNLNEVNRERCPVLFALSVGSCCTRSSCVDLTAKRKERRKKVQAIVPRRVFVHKEFGEELPFKYLVWLCYGLELERDLVLMDEE